MDMSQLENLVFSLSIIFFSITTLLVAGKVFTNFRTPTLSKKEQQRLDKIVARKNNED